jgi:hypothetical protein
MPELTVLTATAPSPSHVENEDRVIVCDKLIAVLDGVSAPAGLDTGCRHTVAWYVDRLSSRLVEVYASAEKDPLTDLLAKSIDLVRTDHNGQCDLQNPASPAATLCLVRVDTDRMEYLILSDCTLVVEDVDSVTAITDHRFEQAIATIRTPAPARDAQGYSAWLYGHAGKKYQLTNTAHGYWVAAAKPDAAHQAITGALPLTGPKAVQRAALLTDGASRAVDTFAFLDWHGLLDVATTLGPAELIRRVRNAEAESGQPKPERLPTKLHDDATIALCLFSQEPK